MKKRGLFSYLFLLSVILLILPVIVYNYSRVMGGLPSELGWAAIEPTNKGPWISSWQGATIYLPILATMLFVVVGLFQFIRLRGREGLKYIGAAVIQYIVTYGILDALMWTVSS